MSRATERFRRRREEERRHRREEERAEAARQAALEKRREEEREATREEERRQAALAWQREQEVREEARRALRQAFLRRFRQQRRTRRRQALRTEARREAAQQTRREDGREEGRQEEQAGARREAAQQSQREEARQEAQAEAKHEAAQQARREEARREARPATRREEQRRSERAAQVEATRRDTARQEARRERRTEALAAERQAARRADQRQQRQEAARTQARAEARQQAARQEAVARPEPTRGGQRLPSGRLSDNLPWLHAEGPRLLDEFDQSVVLRGLSLPGLLDAEPSTGQSVLDAAHLAGDTLSRIIEVWNANVIRLALNQASVLQGRGAATLWDFLEALDELIGTAATAGAYTLLSLVWLDAETPYGSQDGQINRVAPLPDDFSADLWQLLASRYEDEPAVLFDVYSLPHDPLPDDPMRSILPQVSWSLWLDWARALLGVVRAENPRAVVFVSGLDWATDLSGLPVRHTDGAAIHNLVYAAQLYPWRMPDNWEATLGSLATRYPVFVTEWGGRSEHTSWGNRLASFLASRGIGWTAAAWSEVPTLVVERQGWCQSTPFGAVVRRAASMPHPVVWAAP
jgi:hypothetical protein